MISNRLGENIFANKHFVYRIYNKFLQLNNREADDPLKNRYFTKEDI